MDGYTVSATAESRRQEEKGVGFISTELKPGQSPFNLAFNWVIIVHPLLLERRVKLDKIERVQ